MHEQHRAVAVGPRMAQQKRRHDKRLDHSEPLNHLLPGAGNAIEALQHLAP